MASSQERTGGSAASFTSFAMGAKGQFDPHAPPWHWSSSSPARAAIKGNRASDGTYTDRSFKKSLDHKMVGPALIKPGKSDRLANLAAGFAHLIDILG